MLRLRVFVTGVVIRVRYPISSRSHSPGQVKSRRRRQLSSRIVGPRARMLASLDYGLRVWFAQCSCSYCRELRSEIEKINRWGSLTGLVWGRIWGLGRAGLVGGGSG